MMHKRLAFAMIDKRALEESILDVFVGTILAIPIVFTTLEIAKYLSLDTFRTGLLQLIVFTLVGILRRYLIRIYYK
jgi:hypothetical protein